MEARPEDASINERERGMGGKKEPPLLSLWKKILEFDLVLFIIHQPDKYPVGIIYW